MRVVMEQPLERLVRPIQAISRFPLIAVGSGGSFSTADFACFLHRELTRKVALPLTPMAAAGTGIDLRSQAVLLANAGGKNPDVIGVFRTVVAQESQRCIVLCTNLETPLARLASKFSFVNFVEFDLPSGNDGFLATNSLLASTVLLSRSYSEALDISFSLPSDFLYLVEGHERPGARQAFDENCQLLWQRETLVVLHGPTTPGGLQCPLIVYTDLKGLFCNNSFLLPCMARTMPPHLHDLRRLPCRLAPSGSW
jgi:hypothetical protein